MNLASGSLVLFGFLLLVIGVVSKLMGLSLLMPLFSKYASYLTAANTCFLVALLLDRYQK